MADLKGSALPAGSALAGTEKIFGLDGVTNKAWLASQLATYITAIITDSAPGTLDTLNELAAALGDDPNFATTMTTALAGKQPLDADLTAIAALTTTSYGRGLLALADAAALKTAAGLIIGTDVQAHDADLDAIAALATTTYGRALLALADAAALKAAAGLVIGTDVQAYSAALAAIAGLSPAADSVLQYKSGAWASRTLAQLRKDTGARWPVGISGAAVTHTGDTLEYTLASVVIPGGSLGPNGQINCEALFRHTSSANTKTLRGKFGGTTFFSVATTTTATSQGHFRIANANSQTAQVGHTTGAVSGFSSNAGAYVAGAIDTTVDQTLEITGQLTNTAEEITLLSRLIEVTYSA